MVSSSLGSCSLALVHPTGATPPYGQLGRSPRVYTVVLVHPTFDVDDDFGRLKDSPNADWPSRSRVWSSYVNERTCRFRDEGNQVTPDQAVLPRQRPTVHAFKRPQMSSDRKFPLTF